MKILVTDDSKAMRMIVVRTLRQAGFAGLEIIEAENGQIGLSMARAQAPDASRRTIRPSQSSRCAPRNAASGRCDVCEPG